MRDALLTSGLLLLSFGTCAQQDSLPEVNQLIVAFVREHMGKQVGRGECWDLAAAALDTASAKWDGDYGFGRKVDPDREAVLPGDIVQFERVEFRWEEGQDVHTVRMPHHTAVVLEVLGEGSGVKATGAYIIGQQNTQETGRKTGTGDLLLSRRIKGSIRFFRPVE